MPADDEITKMALLFGVSHETLEQEIIEWNMRHPELLRPVIVWMRTERAESNGLAPATTGPQIQPEQGTSLPDIPEGIKPKDRGSYLKWLKGLQEIERLQPQVGNTEPI